MQPRPEAPGLLFEEPLRGGARAWLWLLGILVVSFFAVAPLAAPVAAAAWVVNTIRFAGATIRVDHDYIWVGRRGIRLAALDLDTLGEASNTWPWRSFNRRYLGANPIWTRSSVGLRGRDGTKRCWVSIGTDRREELVSVLTAAVPRARERLLTVRAAYGDRRLPPPGWHEDPWAPETALRWWDGEQWSGFTHPRAPQRLPGAPEPGPSGAPEPGPSA